MGNCCKKKKVETLIDENDINKALDNNEDNPLGIKLKSEDFEKLNLIGKGSFGEVYLVRFKLNDKYYAMKILNKKNIISFNQEEHTKTERDLMVKVNCPFIIDIKFAFQDKQYLYLLTEFMQGGELFFHLFKDKRFNNEKAKFYTIEIILAIDFMHKKKMIYRDLKPENVLIDKTGHIKLTDFGLSKILSKEKEKAYTICGTPQYLAPEILTGDGYDDSVDWWSLGCILYKMLVGGDPFRFPMDESLNPEMYETKVLFPDYISEQAQDLIKKLLVTNTKKRLGYGSNGVEKIKKHSYFEGINWEKAWKKELKPPFIPELKDDLDLKYFDKEFTEERVESYSDIEPSSQTDNFKGFTFIADSFDKSELNVSKKSNDTNSSNY